MNTKLVGDGKVYLVAGGGKLYTDVAAKFCHSQKSMVEILNGEYAPNLVRTLVESNHKAALEFDNFIFAVEGYSRVTEVQLVRKRHASYMISSGRGSQEFSVVVPESLLSTEAYVNIPQGGESLPLHLHGSEVLSIVEQFCEQAKEKGHADEDVRYFKPQATEFRALISMNAAGLRDWFLIRCCRNAQHEIRDMAHKMLSLCRKAAPDLFKDAGASCSVLGYCPEGKLQNKQCVGRIPTKAEALEILRNARN